MDIVSICSKCMPRPFVPRRVGCHLKGLGFRPIGQPACKADAIRIGLDELEAIRLADLEGLYQDAAAERMGVSRQTYARILARARHAVASSLLEARMLVVGSGPVIEDVAVPPECPVHDGPRRHGRTCHCSTGGATCSDDCPHPATSCDGHSRPPAKTTRHPN
jgi:predicted DNA-binding protein (UPF0251 family)